MVQVNGYALIERVIPDEDIRDLRVEADRLLRHSSCRGGVRNLLHKSERFRAEAGRRRLLDLASDALGERARPTKLTLFDKTASANWLIRWHQDLAITVRDRAEEPGFEGWSLKEGVLHVRPPVEVLESIVALRVHLDDTPATNGALRVLLGSHRLGRLSREEIERLRHERGEVVCEVAAGGMMLMSPLLLHASSKAVSPRRRRVLHIEYSGRELPGGLAWA